VLSRHRSRRGKARRAGVSRGKDGPGARATEEEKGVVARLAMRAVAAHSPEAGTKRRNPPYYLDADSCQHAHGEEEVGAAPRARRIRMGGLDGGEQGRRRCGGGGGGAALEWLEGEREQGRARP
jgi:hypothetical protein